MRRKWYGTASLLIEGGDTRILIDPYLKGFNPKLPQLPIEEAKTASAIFITHPHLDHFSDIATFTEAGIYPVYVSQNGIEHAAKHGVLTDAMLAIEPNMSFYVGDIHVRIFQSRHCVFDAATICSVLFSPRTYAHAKTAVRLLKQMRGYQIDDDIYAFEFSHGGKKIMVLGSAGMDENTEYPDGADLFVFPYQGRSKMHRHMESFLEEFQPKAVMIDHFDDAFPPLTRSVKIKYFVPTVKKHLPEARAIVPVEGEWYDV